MRFVRRDRGVRSRRRKKQSRTSPYSSSLRFEALEDRRLLTLVGQWLFDEGSGTVAADSTANHDNGTLVNSPTWVSGPTGNGTALQFNGSNQSVSLGNPSALNLTGQITISAWLYNSSTTIQTDGIRDIVTRGYGNAAVFLRSWGTNYQIGCWDGSSDHLANATIDPIDLNHWIQITGVYDGSAWRIYKNGVLQSSNTDSTGAISVNTGWTIGASLNRSWYFKGAIDGVSIYDTGLSASAVAALYSSPGKPGTLSASKSGSTVSLSWGAASGTVTGYNVYRGTSLGLEASTPINASPIVGTTYNDTTADLSPGAGDYYVVTALNGNIISNNSNEASVLVPLATTEAGTFQSFPSNKQKPVQEFMLLTDGTVIAQEPGSNATTWLKLTPSSTGSYRNGTWTTLASSSTIRDYMASAVLQNGKVFIAGGEYGPNGAFDSVSGGSAELYDPLTNTWTSLPTQGSGFYDAETKMLPDGRILVGAVTPSPSHTAEIFNPANNTWSTTPAYVFGSTVDEASWLQLPDGSILMADTDNVHSERYIPSLGKWVADASVGTNLFYGGEEGPALMLPNGTGIFFGGGGNTAIYHPSGTNSPGTWTVGPKIPYGLAAADVPAAMMRDGKIILSIGPPGASGVPNGMRYVAYDYVTNTFQDINFGSQARPEIMMTLPDGSVLMSNLSTLWQFTPTAGVGDSSWAPTITSITANTDGTWTLTGTQLNGFSSGGAMGDDFQMATNYPIVQLTLGTNKYYARTTNWSLTGVQTGSTPETVIVTLPAGLAANTSYNLSVIANGIPSAAVSVSTAATPGQPVLLAASDTGVSNTDRITNLDNSSAGNVLTFSVSQTVAGATITLYADGTTVVGSAVATGATTTITTNGTFDLTDGTHSITARQTQPGQPQSIDSMPVVLTIDTVAPASPGNPDLVTASDSGVSSFDNITNVVAPTFSIAGSPYFRFYQDGVLLSSNYQTGSTYTTATLADATYSFTVTAVDAAGNESAPSSGLSVTIDSVAPDVPDSPVLTAGSDSGFSNSDDITNDTTPTFSATAAPYFRFYQNNARVSSLYTSGSFFTTSAQSDGTYAYSVTAVDAAGNESGPSNSVSVTIDTVAPASPSAPDLSADSDTGVSNSDNITNDVTPTFDVVGAPYFAFYQNGSRISAIYESGTSYTTPPRIDGTFAYSVTAVDAAGNESAPSSSLNVTIDTQNPSVTINQASGQIDPTSVSPINFTVVFSKAMSDFTAGGVSFDGSTVAGTLVGTVTNPSGDLETYNVAVSGMTGAGIVVASVAAAAAHDLAGNANTASLGSDQSVTYLPPTEVVGRHVFYNDSMWDGNDASGNAGDDVAIAADKEALLPGQSASFVNYTSYTAGINGVMIDVAGLTATPSASSFMFKVGNDGDPSNWIDAPSPVSVSIRSGAGVNGSDRIEPRLGGWRDSERMVTGNHVGRFWKWRPVVAGCVLFRQRDRREWKFTYGRRGGFCRRGCRPHPRHGPGRRNDRQPV